jgi:uncharacterized membrane protein YciS (DUF1049 family)
MKLKKKTFVIFLALFLTALKLGGANRMRLPNNTLQSFGWFSISFVALVFLVFLGFVALPKLIEYYMHKTNDHLEE